ncbi:MAG TPA: hypothetical protein VGN34_25385, partial [Ktedonobacteraceae bacterium]
MSDSPGTWDDVINEVQPWYDAYERLVKSGLVTPERLMAECPGLSEESAGDVIRNEQSWQQMREHERRR